MCRSCAVQEDFADRLAQAACCPDRGRRARRGPPGGAIGQEGRSGSIFRCRRRRRWRGTWRLLYPQGRQRRKGHRRGVLGVAHGHAQRPGRPPSAATRPGPGLRPGRHSPESTTKSPAGPKRSPGNRSSRRAFRCTRCVLCQATSATFSATSGVKRTTTSRSGPGSGIIRQALRRWRSTEKPRRNAIRPVEHFQQEDAAEVEGPRGPVQRRAADHVPTSLAEQQAVGIEPRENDLLLGQALVANAHAAVRRNRIDQLLIDGRAAVQRIAGRRVDHHGVGRGAQLLAECGPAGCFPASPPRCAPARRTAAGRPTHDRARPAPGLPRR